MVEVFKTNVSEPLIAKNIILELQVLLPGASINFDMEDCDKILRVAYSCIDAKQIINTLNKSGYDCAILDG